MILGWIIEAWDLDYKYTASGFPVFQGQIRVHLFPNNNLLLLGSVFGKVCSSEWQRRGRLAIPFLSKILIFFVVGCGDECDGAAGCMQPPPFATAITLQCITKPFVFRLCLVRPKTSRNPECRPLFSKVIIYCKVSRRKC